MLYMALVTRNAPIRQPLNARLCLEVLTVHGTKLLLFWAKAFPYCNYYYRAPDISAVGTTFKVFGYDAVLGPDSNRQRAHKTITG